MINKKPTTYSKKAYTQQYMNSSRAKKRLLILRKLEKSRIKIDKKVWQILSQIK